MEKPAALAAAALVLAACGGPSKEEARRLVQRYNDVVSEAYRRGDARLIDPVVGAREGTKITGLIGVRLDLGLTLDAQMLSLEVTGVERDGEALRVRTRERWSYCDRRVGSGEAAGPASTDAYAMAYCFVRTNKAWVVDAIEFAEPPQVGRTQMTWAIERHGPPGSAAGGGGAP